MCALIFLEKVFCRDSIGILFPPAPPPPLLSVRRVVRWYTLQTDSGGFASSWLQAPNKSKSGRKSWTRSSSGKKSIFPQIARCSTRARLPTAGDASLTSSNSSPEIRSQTEKLLDRYENGRVGRAKAEANASLEPSGSFFSPGMFPTTCPFPGGHPPLPRKWQVSFH